MKLSLLITLAAFVSSAPLGFAQAPEVAPEEPNFAAAKAATRADLDAALKRLRDVRTEIAGEEPALAAEFAMVQSELITKRRQAELARLSRQDRDAALRQTEIELHTLKQDLKYTGALVSDLPGQLRERAVSAEFPVLDERFPAPLPNTASPQERLKSGSRNLELALDRLETLLGGRSFAGNAIAPDGREISGEFAVAGPLTWFANGEVAAPVRLGGDLIAHLAPVKGSDPAPIRKLVNEGKATVAVDLTGGSAQALAELDSGPLELIKKGGFWVLPILAIALVSALFGLFKFLQLAKIRTPKEGWVAEILSALRDQDAEGAKAIAATVKHPAGEVISKALEHVDAGAEVVEEVLYESMIGVQARLQKWLPFIAITAATAPLLGLLGTVAGMIETFNVIQLFGSGDPKPLAGGISEALITTLFGLVVAIPALILHAVLSRRSQGIQQNTEQLGLTLVNGLRSQEKREPAK